MRKTLFRGIQKVPGIHLVEFVQFENFLVVINPKVASRSIINEKILISGGDSSSHGQISNHTEYMSRTQFVEFSNGKRVFAFVRDPIQRIVSCWRQKVSLPDNCFRLGGQYFVTYYPFIRAGMSLEHFIRSISSIPDWMSEKHFMSQSRLLMVDYVKYDALFALDRFGDAVQHLCRLDERLSFNKISNVTDSREFAEKLPPDIINLITKRYRDDFLLFNNAMTSSIY